MNTLISFYQCGFGMQERWRTCNYDLFGQDQCTESGKNEKRACNTHLKPCEYEWANWGEVGPCPVTCGEGFRERKRNCRHKITKEQVSAESNCEGPSLGRVTCENLGKCPYWSEWREWSNCPVTCLANTGHKGSRFRRRDCVNGYVGQIGCPQKDIEEKEFCNTMLCPMWSVWAEWTRCSASCGAGERERKRTCRNGNGDDSACAGDSTQVSMCQAQLQCPYFENWSSWSPCSVSCEGGDRTRTRICRKFSKKQECQADEDGNDEDAEVCGTNPCPYWAEWMPWIECDRSCGSGVLKRTRGCVNGKVGQVGCSAIRPDEIEKQKVANAQMGSQSMAGMYGGFYSRGRYDEETTTAQPQTQPTQPPAEEEVIPCNTEPCPGDIPSSWQPWGSWVEWTHCNVTCGGGSNYRYRVCQAFKPDPNDWRKKVIDSNMCHPADQDEFRACNTKPCPFWAEWTEWTACEADTCMSDGKQNMTRKCINGKSGEVGCEETEPNVRYKECFHSDCAHWSVWYSWSTCSRSCEGGFHVRERYCLLGEVGEIGCESGEQIEKAACETQRCPSWSSWSRWTECNAPCGQGHHKSKRHCLNGYKDLAGCKGPAEREKPCFRQCEQGGVCYKSMTCKCPAQFGWTVPKRVQEKRTATCTRPPRCGQCHKHAACLEDGKCVCIKGYRIKVQQTNKN